MELAFSVLELAFSVLELAFSERKLQFLNWNWFSQSWTPVYMDGTCIP